MAIQNRFTPTGQHKAFTLIELLVVIGLIAVLAGGIGLAFSGGDKANALQGAQGTLQSMVSAVRGQAALAGKDAALFVNVTNTPAVDPERYLRSFVVAVKNDSGQWEVTGDEITLPSGIYLVPNATGTFGGASFIETDGTYPRSSGFDGTIDTNLRYPNSGGPYGGRYALVVSLSSRGTKILPSGANTSDLVLSPAERNSATTIVFKQPNLVRGAIISSYGVLTPINDATGF